MFRIATAVFALLAFGCGRPNDEDAPITIECAPDACPPPDDAFNGLWEGEVTVDLSQPDLFTYLATLSMQVSGYSVSVEGVCPDGSGSFEAVGSGGDLAWTGVGGDVECVLVDSPCPRKTVRFTGATIAFLGGGYIRMDLATECGSHSAAAAFVGLPRDVTLPTEH